MKAIILLSGGLDSAVVLAMALEKGKTCHALSFDYGQRHKRELLSAQLIANYYHISHKIIKIDPDSFGASSLVSIDKVPKNRSLQEMSSGAIPNTYVPARNTLFLAYALGQAEMLKAQEIHAGMNAMDRYAYPDCRPEFITAFQSLINVATQQAVNGAPPRLVAPLINWNKTEIIKQGLALKAPLHLTWSCYDPSLEDKPCQQCDACLLRQNAFKETLTFDSPYTQMDLMDDMDFMDRMDK